MADFRAKKKKVEDKYGTPYTWKEHKAASYWSNLEINNAIYSTALIIWVIQ